MIPLVALQDPGRGKASPAGLFAGAAAMFQLRLLEVYLALPNANAFAPEHETLSKLCARPLRGMSSCISTGEPAFIYLLESFQLLSSWSLCESEQSNLQHGGWSCVTADADAD